VADWLDLVIDGVGVVWFIVMSWFAACVSLERGPFSLLGDGVHTAKEPPTRYRPIACDVSASHIDSPRCIEHIGRIDQLQNGQLEVCTEI
jgi:hypothetical protein